MRFCLPFENLEREKGPTKLKQLPRYYTVQWARKVLAHLFVMQIRGQLLKLQRPGESKFTLGKMTSYRHESRQGMFAAYVDPKTAFDSLHREVPWGFLRLPWVFCKDRWSILSGRYFGSKVLRRLGGGEIGSVSSFLPVSKGVRQGCVCPKTSPTCMYWVLGLVADQSHCGASIGNTKFIDLVLTYFSVILVESLKFW